MAYQLTMGYFISDHFEPGISEDPQGILSIDGKSYSFKIPDFHIDDLPQLRHSYIRQANGFMLVYAIDDRDSFDKVKYFYDEIKKYSNDPDIPIILCGNKVDFEEKRVVAKSEGEKLAQELNVSFYETSALANENIKEAFEDIARKAYYHALPGKKDEEQRKPKKKAFLHTWGSFTVKYFSSFSSLTFLFFLIKYIFN